MTSLADRILAVLPQTQCTRCAYPDCAAYASAIASDQAAINQCPPGGEQGIARIAAVTGRTPLPLNPEHGTEAPRSVAYIDENWCIGCTLCIDICPTDAIMGSNKLMHTVIEPHCTGCELCIPVCPVDCIILENSSGSATAWDAWSPQLAEQARTRYAFHQLRQRRNEGENQIRLEKKAMTKLTDLSAHSLHTDPQVLDQKRAVIEAVLARSRAKREQP